MATRTVWPPASPGCAPRWREDRRIEPRRTQRTRRAARERRERIQRNGGHGGTRRDTEGHGGTRRDTEGHGGTRRGKEKVDWDGQHCRFCRFSHVIAGRNRVRAELKGIDGDRQRDIWCYGWQKRQEMARSVCRFWRRM